MNTEYILKIKLSSNDGNKIFTHYDGDAGLDILNPEIVIPAKSKGKIKFGIHCEMLKKTIFNINAINFEKTEGCSFLLMPRSSISKTPLRMANSIGLIDSGYRGELMAVVDNISDTDYIVEKDSRLFQIVNSDLKSFSKVEYVDELSETSRGDGGFGSTGK